MKNILIATAFVLVPFVTFADEATTTPDVSTSTSPVVVEVSAPAPVVLTSISTSGGYSDVCVYIRAYSSDPCTFFNSEVNTKFRMDAAFRESILTPWRIAIFGY